MTHQWYPIAQQIGKFIKEAPILKAALWVVWLYVILDILRMWLNINMDFNAYLSRSEG